MSRTAADCSGRTFWPVSEAEALSAAHFTGRGLAGLVAGPAAEPVFTPPVLGAAPTAVEPTR